MSNKCRHYITLIANCLQLKINYVNIPNILMDYVKKLKKSPYKATKPRLAVIEYLQKNSKPQTIKKIYQAVKKQNINLASVYRAIKLFQKISIVFEENILSQSCYYLTCKHHHHIICYKCHSIECIPCHMKFKNPANFKNIEHQLVLTGLCKKCAR